MFTFVKYYNNCSAPDAVKILESYAGVEGVNITPKQKLEATNVCKKFICKSNQKSYSLKTLPDNSMDKYERRLDKMAVWEREGISIESMDRFQVRYDRFSDRLVYPIRNINGDIMNIGGRALDPNWKEKGLRKYTYFSGWNGGMNVIYGLSENIEEIRRKKEIIIFEGCKSVLMADGWGIKNTGALLTSHLSPAQLKILLSLEARVVFALDKDVKIKDDHNINKLKRYTNVFFLCDTDGCLDSKDSPTDKGLDVFVNLYKKKYRLI